MCECKGKIEVLRPKVVKMAIIQRPVRKDCFWWSRCLLNL